MKLFKTLFFLSSLLISSCTLFSVPVENIALNESSFTFFVSDTKQLTATVYPNNATNKEVVWSVNNNHVSISDTGFITALSAGKCTVTCSSKENSKISAKCSITVKDNFYPVTSITLNKTSLSLFPGESETLTATVKPNNATKKDIKWSSSNDEFATVSSTGVISALKPGDVDIVASTTDGSDLVATCKLNIKAKILVNEINVLLNGQKITNLPLIVNDKKVLSAEVLPSDAYDKSVQWSSSDSSVVAITQDGEISALKKGTCQISATNILSQVSGFATITVKDGTEPKEFLPSEYYGTYYPNDFSWKNGEDLKKQLSSLMNDKRLNILNYGDSKTNWATNQEADRSENDFEMLDAVYTADDVFYSRTQKGWQREHAFCASLMTGLITGDAVDNDNPNIKERANDFQNLFAADAGGNQSRSNKNLGTAGTYGAISTIGDCKYDVKNFEPSDHDKGRLARSLFYMATMYGFTTEFDPLTLKEGYVDFDGKNNPAAHGNLSTLLSWANSFAVDRLEMQHNISIATSNVSGKVQGNRNCFTDYPQLIDYIWGSKKEMSGQLKDLEPALYTLDMCSNTEYYNFAIKHAVRTYPVGSKVDLLNDLNLVNVKKDNTFVSVDSMEQNFIISEIEDEHVFTTSEIGMHMVSIIPSKNNTIDYSKEDKTITYFYEVVEENPIDHCDYKHTLTGGSKDGEFNSIKDRNNEVHTLNFDGVDFDVYWKEGIVDSLSAKTGTKFGTKATPVERLTFTTTNNYLFNNHNKFDEIYISGATSANTSATINIYVNDYLVYAGTMLYNEYAQTYGTVLDSPASGIIKYEIIATKGVVYIQTIAINSVN